MNRIFLIIICCLLLLTGCESDNHDNTQSNLEYSATKQEAIEKFIDKNSVQGFLVEIEKTEDHTLLLAEERERVFFVGELVEKDGAFSCQKITAEISLLNNEGNSLGFGIPFGETTYSIEVYTSEENRSSFIVGDTDYSFSVTDEESDKNMVEDYMVLKKPSTIAGLIIL